MKFAGCCAVYAFLALSAGVGPASAGASGSPVEKVVKLLEDLQTKIKADGAMEKGLYEKYSCWCTSMTASKGAAIEQAKKDLKKLGSEIMSLRSKVATLSSEIADISSDMKDNEDEQKEATEKRDKENASFTALKAELDQALASLKNALTFLGPKSALLQTSDASKEQLATALKGVMEALPASSLGVLSDTKLAALQKAVAAAQGAGKQGYEPASGTIAGILKEMDSTLEADFEKATKAEKQAKEDYSKLMNSKKEELETFQEQVHKKLEKKAEAAVDLAQTTQNYDDTAAQMDADVEFFDNAVDSCEKKAKSWETRTKLRDEELEGIAKALEILTSDSARELFAKAIDPGHAILSKASFLQIQSVPDNKAMPEKQRQAVQALKDLASKSRSLRLAKVVSEVRVAQAGHFDKAISQIEKVISDLKDEEQADKDKRDECKDKYQKNAKEDAKLTWKIEKNEAKIAKLEATIAQHEADKAETIQNIEDVQEEMKKMTKERKEENEAFKEAKKDDEDAVKLLESAKSALEAYYKKNDVEVLVQRAEPEFDRGDAAPDAKFSGKDSRAGQTKAIVLLFENILEDLAGEIKAGIAAEKDSVEEYDKNMKAAEKLEDKLIKKKKRLIQDIADRTKDKDDEEDKMTENVGDLKDVRDYKADIKPDCDFIIENFDSRYTKRQAELDGLVQAKGILSAASLVQASPRTSLRARK